MAEHPHRWLAQEPRWVRRLVGSWRSVGPRARRFVRATHKHLTNAAKRVPGCCTLRSLVAPLPLRTELAWTLSCRATLAVHSAQSINESQTRSLPNQSPESLQGRRTMTSGCAVVQSTVGENSFKLVGCQSTRRTQSSRVHACGRMRKKRGGRVATVTPVFSQAVRSSALTRKIAECRAA